MTKSSLLNYAARRNVKDMAHKRLQLGGDVTTQKGLRRRGINDQQLTPLGTAALYEHERMVKLFLRAQAKQDISNVRVPLKLVFANCHGSVAILLCKKLGPDDRIEDKGRTILQLAYDAQMIALVRNLLVDTSQRCTRLLDQQDIRNRSTVLWNVLHLHASTDDCFKRAIHEVEYQIVSLLVHQRRSRHANSKQNG
jgi:ankyrin repeat protein